MNLLELELLDPITVEPQNESTLEGPTTTIKRSKKIQKLILQKLRAIDLIPLDLLGLVILLFFLLPFYLFNLAGRVPESYDEGVYLSTSFLLNHGFKPYTEVFMSQPPFLFLFDAGVMRLSNGSLYFARFVLVICAFIGLIAVFLSVKSLLNDHFSGQQKKPPQWLSLFPWLAVLLLGIISVDWFYYGRYVAPNVPEAAFSILGFWFFLQSVKRVKVGFFEVVAGVSLSIATLFKLFGVISMPILFLAYFFLKEKDQRFKSMIVFGVGIVLPFLSLFFFDLPALYHQMFGFHMHKQRSWEVTLASLNAFGYWFIRENFLFFLAPVSFIPCFLSKKKMEKWAGICAVFNFVPFLFYSPLYTHHLVHVTPFVTITMTLAFYKLIRYLRAKYQEFLQKRTTNEEQNHSQGFITRVSRFIKSRYHKKPVFVSVITLLIIIAAFIPLGIYRNQIKETNSDSLTTANFIADYLGNDEWLITDGAEIPYLSNRLIPPSLVDISFERIKAKDITSQELIAIAQDYNVSLILYWSSRLLLLDEWNEFVVENYELAFSYDYQSHKWVTNSSSISASEITNGLIWILK